ncbi:MAG: YceI family protein [Chloroflexi bacterium]|nr:YceI family protein [Chloroflexota bacterium]
MSSRTFMSIVGILVLMGVTAAATIFIYVSTVGGSGEPSEPISAPTLDLSTPTPDPRGTQIAQLSTQVAELAAANATLSAQPAAVLPEATAVAEATEAAPAEAAPASDQQTLFRIVPEESEVRFILTEDLRGVPTTVVGKTNQVAGEILVDFSAPANSRVGMIRINARTLATDNNFRNGAIRDRILQSNRAEYEFTEFTPTAISGLPETVEIGQPVTFQITGDLKVRNIVKPVTFDATVTVVSEDRLEGTAKATIQRGDFNLQIPSAPGVANVSEAVDLEIDLVAARVEA